MRNIALALLAVFAAPAAAQPKSPKPALAVVEVLQRVNECSGAGGEHYVLLVHDGGKTRRLAHAGGHAIYLSLLPMPKLAAQRAPVFLLAELDMTARPAPRNPGWCLDGLPAFDGSARRLVRAKSRADAEKLRARFASTGLPGTPPAWGTVVIDPDRTTGE